jgi:hypothetical protein
MAQIAAQQGSGGARFSSKRARADHVRLILLCRKIGSCPQSCGNLRDGAFSRVFNPNPAQRRAEPEGMRHGETYQEPETCGA